LAIENSGEKESDSEEQDDAKPAKAGKPFDNLPMRHLFVQILPQRFP
jgi:hypothetical protein